jgi:hypothetical protein
VSSKIGAVVDCHRQVWQLAAGNGGHAWRNIQPEGFNPAFGSQSQAIQKHPGAHAHIQYSQMWQPGIQQAMFADMVQRSFKRFGGCVLRILIILQRNDFVILSLNDCCFHGCNGLLLAGLLPAPLLTPVERTVQFLRMQIKKSLRFSLFSLKTSR